MFLFSRHGASRSGTLTNSDGQRAHRSGFVAVMLSAAVVLAGCGASDNKDDTAGKSNTSKGGGAAEATKLRIAYVPATTGLLLHVAEKQGFFEKNGLDVTLTPSANISDIPPALGRQFDISLGTATDLIRATKGGLDIVQISGNTNSTEENPFVKLIVPKDSPINDVGDLAGKRVASPTLTGVIHVATQYSAKQKGVDPKSIKGVQVPPPNIADQLKAGMADAVEALEPSASQLIAAGNRSLGDPFASIRLPLATNFWIANGEWARDNSEAIDAFGSSLEQAIDFVKQNEPEARATLQEYTDLPAPVAARVPLPTFNLEIRTGDLEKWIEVLRDLGEDVGDVKASQLVVD